MFVFFFALLTSRFSFFSSEFSSSLFFFFLLLLFLCLFFLFHYPLVISFSVVLLCCSCYISISGCSSPSFLFIFLVLFFFCFLFVCLLLPFSALHHLPNLFLRLFCLLCKGGFLETGFFPGKFSMNGNIQCQKSPRTHIHVHYYYYCYFVFVFLISCWAAWEREEVSKAGRRGVGLGLLIPGGGGWRGGVPRLSPMQSPSAHHGFPCKTLLA